MIVFFGRSSASFAGLLLFPNDRKDSCRFTKEEALKKYEVPFLIWANYDITEKEIDHISLNYLSTEMAVDTGQSMSAYQCFLNRRCNRKFLPCLIMAVMMQRGGITRWRKHRNLCSNGSGNTRSCNIICCLTVRRVSYFTNAIFFDIIRLM